MLSQEENEILDFLKPFGRQFATPREICRRAGGKQRFNEDRDWAKPFLKKMEKKGLLEVDASGHYRIKVEDDGKRSVPLSPHIQRILAQSGKDFSEATIIEVDEDYEKLSKSNKGKTS